MIKATGPVCNLDCDYCYYLSKSELLSTDSRWRISDETLENFISQYIGQQNYREVVFSWQGGEPTLLGLDFFRKVVALQKKVCPLVDALPERPSDQRHAAYGRVVRIPDSQ